MGKDTYNVNANYIKITGVDVNLKKDLEEIASRTQHGNVSNLLRPEIRKIANKYLGELRITPASEGGMKNLDD